jgi:hypothetical protein
MYKVLCASGDEAIESHPLLERLDALAKSRKVSAGALAKIRERVTVSLDDDRTRHAQLHERLSRLEAAFFEASRVLNAPADLAYDDSERVCFVVEAAVSLDSTLARSTHALEERRDRLQTQLELELGTLRRVVPYLGYSCSACASAPASATSATSMAAADAVAAVDVASVAAADAPAAAAVELPKTSATNASAIEATREAVSREAGAVAREMAWREVEGQIGQMRIRSGRAHARYEHALTKLKALHAALDCSDLTTKRMLAAAEVEAGRRRRARGSPKGHQKGKRFSSGPSGSLSSPPPTSADAFKDASPTVPLASLPTMPDASAAKEGDGGDGGDGGSDDDDDRGSPSRRTLRPLGQGKLPAAREPLETHSYGANAALQRLGATIDVILARVPPAALASLPPAASFIQRAESSAEVEVSPSCSSPAYGQKLSPPTSASSPVQFASSVVPTTLAPRSPSPSPSPYASRSPSPQRQPSRPHSPSKVSAASGSARASPTPSGTTVTTAAGAEEAEEEEEEGSEEGRGAHELSRRSPGQHDSHHPLHRTQPLSREEMKAEANAAARKGARAERRARRQQSKADGAVSSHARMRASCSASSLYATPIGGVAGGRGGGGGPMQRQTSLARLMHSAGSSTASMHTQLAFLRAKNVESSSMLPNLSTGATYAHQSLA